MSNFTVTSSTEFSFDNEIVNARAYRNAYQNYNRAIKEKKVPARNEKVSSSSTATDLIELGDDETLKTPAISGLTISDTSVFSLGSATDLHSLFERQPKPDESQEDAEPPADNESDATTLVEKEKKHKATVAMIRAQVLAERKFTTPDKAAGPRISEVPTLLHVAAYGDRLDLAKKYLESNLDPNILHGPWSPLNIAIQSENIPMVKLLLAHGADVELVGSEKRYPLVNACQMGNGQIINLLLEHGADPNTITEAGVTSLIAAMRHDNPTIVEPLLIKGALPDTQANTDGFTALHMAAGDNQEKIMKLLMRYGASPEVTCDKFGSALHIAATKGHLEATKLLLKAGVEVDAVGGEDSQTALHQSVRNSHKEVTGLLLQFRANPDARDAKDIPVWHRAIQAERADILEMLLWKTRPALILENTYTKIKVTGLQMAALRGNPSIVAVLLKMGADPTNKGAMGHHPLALAGNEETRKLLQNAADAWISRLQKTAE
jgi:ankyrin repeat protein